MSSPCKVRSEASEDVPGDPSQLTCRGAICHGKLVDSMQAFGCIILQALQHDVLQKREKRRELIMGADKDSKRVSAAAYCGFMRRLHALGPGRHELHFRSG